MRNYIKSEAGVRSVEELETIVIYQKLLQNLSEF